MPRVEVQLRPVTDEAERQRTDQFLRSLIAGPSGAPMLPAQQERQAGVDSLVLGAYDRDRLVGALWGGDPYTEFLLDPSMAAWPRQEQTLLVTNFLMLHHVAVVDTYRGQGIGRHLLKELIRYAKARRKIAVYGVADPTSRGFYQAAGFEVAGAQEAIYLSVWPSHTFQFPMEGDHRWFAHTCGGVFARGRAHFAPPTAR